MSEYYQEPGYKEALAREAQIRAEAWLGIEEPICGIEIGPLTLRKILYLEIAGNAFISPVPGKEPAMYDCALFLWVASSDFSETDHKARERFYQEPFLECKVDEAVQGINELLERTWFDLPGGQPSSGHKTPVTYWMAGYVHAFSSSYNWNLDTIMDSPLRQMLQLYRCMMIEGNPEAAFTLPNPLTDPFKAAWLERLNAEVVEAN